MGEVGLGWGVVRAGGNNLRPVEGLIPKLVIPGTFPRIFAVLEIFKYRFSINKLKRVITELPRYFLVIQGLGFYGIFAERNPR